MSPLLERIAFLGSAPLICPLRRFLSPTIFFAQTAVSPLPRRLPDILCPNLEFTSQPNLCAACNRANLILALKRKKQQIRLDWRSMGHWIKQMLVARRRGAIERVTCARGEVLELIVSVAERQTFAKSISNIHHRKMDNFM